MASCNCDYGCVFFFFPLLRCVVVVKVEWWLWSLVEVVVAVGRGGCGVCFFIILLCCLCYFIVLKAKIKLLILCVL